MRQDLLDTQSALSLALGSTLRKLNMCDFQPNWPLRPQGSQRLAGLAEAGNQHQD